MLNMLIAAALQVFSGQAESPAVAESDDEIVVVAPSREQVQEVVGALSEPSGQGQLARWHRNICVAVVGLPEPEARFVADRIGVVAASVGVMPGAAGCRPNAVIYYTREPDQIAQTIAGRRTWSSGGGFSGTRGRRALRDFATTDQPVRWWHVSEGVATDSQNAADGAASGMSMQRTSAGLVGATVLDEMPSQRVTYHGRLRRDTRRDFTQAYVVADAAAMTGVSLGSLADYLAMVVLAQLSPEPVPGLNTQPSILNLFTETPNARALTAWDRAYLHGLYHGPANALVQDAQEREIVRAITAPE